MLFVEFVTWGKQQCTSSFSLLSLGKVLKQFGRIFESPAVIEYCVSNFSLKTLGIGEKTFSFKYQMLK